MAKKVAAVQSNYIPWRGYFDLINSVDEFVLYDDVQYTIRDWRNRNKIKTSNGLLWLTIPVSVKSKYLQKIKDTVISEPTWQRKHWNSIAHSYSRAEYFPAYRSYLEELYADCEEKLLSRINHRFIVAICQILGIITKISWSMDYELIGDKSERLAHICSQAGATKYISGPAAKSYLDESEFEARGIAVEYMDYSGYRPYKQLYPPFESQVSILDLILNQGPEAPKYMKSF